MSDTQIPSDDAERPVPSDFDKICSEVEDFEILPTVPPNPIADALEDSEEKRTAPLDKLILGGLVSP